jgi:zinc transport system ATP-binding protein
LYELVSSGITNRASFFGLSKSDRSNVDSAIESVGLTDYARRKYSSLSGGQLRRALIARALVANAELLLLDEPLAGLDRESIVSVVKLLEKLKANGFSMIVVSHELADLEGLFTRVIELENRLVKYDGVPLDRHHQRSAHHHQPQSPDIGISL